MKSRSKEEKDLLYATLAGTHSKCGKEGPILNGLGWSGQDSQVREGDLSH